MLDMNTSYELLCSNRHICLYLLQKQKNETMAPLKRRIKIFLKGAYFINLLIFLAVMVVVTLRQNNNYYQCESITVRSEYVLKLHSIMSFCSMSSNVQNYFSISSSHGGSVGGGLCQVA